MTKEQAQKKVEKLGRKWQGLLNLSHWRIEFIASTAEEMNTAFGYEATEQYYGSNYHDTAHMISFVYIVYKLPEGDKSFPIRDRLVRELFGMERTIIHELLHLVFIQNMDDLLEEQTINLMTETLITLQQGGDKT